MAAQSGTWQFEVDEHAIDDLKRRLQATRYPDQLSDAQWEQGTDVNYLKKLLGKWEGLNGQTLQRNINQHPQYKMLVNGIDMHYVHVPSQHPDAVPLVLLHGWPSSFYEYHKVIPLLTGQTPLENSTTAPRRYFHVVVPSLPGYGFSSAPKTSGFGIFDMALVVRVLMQRLGYSSFAAAGGDWGSIISQILGMYHGDVCKGIYCTMFMGFPSPWRPWEFLQAANALLFPGYPLFLSARETQNLASFRHFHKWESGYQSIQSTKTQTLGYGLTDSPAGLAAWIGEKFYSWTQHDGRTDDFERVLPAEDLLTTLSIYWFSGCITSSMRLYREVLNSPNNEFMRKFMNGPKIKVPTAVAVFPGEITKLPQSWIAARSNLVQYSIMEEGGHFPALEKPQTLAADMLKFLDKLDTMGVRF